MNNIDIFPTMITPYLENGEVDYNGVKELTKWYAKQGCTGIFAVCQSSESMFLTLEERVNIAKTVVATANELKKDGYNLTIVASGHISDTKEKQEEELIAMANTGIDALIFISNRFDIENTCEDKWIEDMKEAISWLPKNLPLGIYECPKPYKRLMSINMLKACLKTGRFKFMKDTCCDIEIIQQRLELLNGTGFGLYNANAQTLLPSLKLGASGYCGVMANFHPSIYVKMVKYMEKNQLKAEAIQSFIAISAFTESLCYPVTAKYYLDKFENIKMTYISRSADKNNLTLYQKDCIDEMRILENYFKKM